MYPLKNNFPDGNNAPENTSTQFNEFMEKIWTDIVQKEMWPSKEEIEKHLNEFHSEKEWVSQLMEPHSAEFYGALKVIVDTCPSHPFIAALPSTLANQVSTYWSLPFENGRHPLYILDLFINFSKPEELTNTIKDLVLKYDREDVTALAFGVTYRSMCLLIQAMSEQSNLMERYEKLLSIIKELPDKFIKQIIGDLLNKPFTETNEQIGEYYPYFSILCCKLSDKQWEQHIQPFFQRESNSSRLAGLCYSGAALMMQNKRFQSRVETIFKVLGDHSSISPNQMIAILNCFSKDSQAELWLLYCRQKFSQPKDLASWLLSKTSYDVSDVVSEKMAELIKIYLEKNADDETTMQFMQEFVPQESETEYSEIQGDFWSNFAPYVLDLSPNLSGRLWEQADSSEHSGSAFCESLVWNILGLQSKNKRWEEVLASIMQAVQKKQEDALKDFFLDVCSGLTGCELYDDDDTWNKEISRFFQTAFNNTRILTLETCLQLFKTLLNDKNELTLAGLLSSRYFSLVLAVLKHSPNMRSEKSLRKILDLAAGHEVDSVMVQEFLKLPNAHEIFCSLFDKTSNEYFKTIAKDWANLIVTHSKEAGSCSLWILPLDLNKLELLLQQPTMHDNHKLFLLKEYLQEAVHLDKFVDIGQKTTAILESFEELGIIDSELFFEAVFLKILPYNAKKACSLTNAKKACSLTREYLKKIPPEFRTGPIFQKLLLLEQASINSSQDLLDLIAKLNH